MNSPFTQQINLQFTPKQFEYVRKANHFMNFKIGATQCGKTHLDIAQIIPQRILERRKKPGLTCIFGVSKGTIERNILSPMREIWGDRLIGSINSENIARIFGDKVYCLGTATVDQVKIIRGMRIKYLYWDEICEANEEVWELAKSRLSYDYSLMDATANPKDPNHYIKKFIEKPDVDVYVQSYTIFDNPFLPKRFVDELCRQYAGTVFYDRYILGQWKRAEGAIYRTFIDNLNEFIIDTPPKDIMKIMVGIDFGGNGSAHAFIAVAYTRGFKEVVVLDEKLIKDAITPQELEIDYVKFANNLYNEYRQAFETYFDNAEPVLARGIAEACLRYHVPTIVKPAYKTEIIGRIRLTNALMGTRRLKIMRKCKNLIGAWQDAVWKEKQVKDERLDNGSYCVDVLDAFEYCIERDMKILLSLNNN